MSQFSSYFLRAKHWQVFLLFFVLFCLLLAVSVSDRGESIAFVALAGIGELCFLAWLGSIGSFLSSVGQPPLRLSGGFFRLALIYPPLYMGAA